MAKSNKRLSTEEIIALDEQYGAHNYHPLPVVIAKAEGVKGEDAKSERRVRVILEGAPVRRSAEDEKAATE